MLGLMFWVVPGNSSASIPEFFSDLFVEVQSQYMPIRESKFAKVCNDFGLDPTNAANRQKFFKVYFLHDLLTTEKARDCVTGGFLQIPYFWHWVEPNPRHSIMSVPKGVLLTEIKPPVEYGKYKTFADIGRVPALFLGDLVSETPLYSHPRCGTFFSFGWCSEREMSFTAVMRAWGFPGKIVQDGIHTWSMVWCDFVKADGTTIGIEGSVDNTFDTVSWKKVAIPDQVDQWVEKTGNGSHVDYYNRKAGSLVQAEAINGKTVSEIAKTRILKSVRSAIANRR